MKEVVIGFLGCGNVGGGVWSLLTGFSREIAHRDSLSIRIKRVLVRDVNKTRACGVPHELLTTNADDVVNDPEISIVVEFMGGEQPATDYMLRALENGKTVVTANKVAIALNWHRLQAAAQRNHVGLYYEASVCGAIPIINTLMQPLQANRIDSLMGIINGTTNYILSRMYENGEDYEAVLHDAQQLGLAEPNPSADVEGLDAAYKLSIMASLAFHARVPFSKVYREGITKITAVDIAYAREMGYVLKLLAIAKRSGSTIEVRVHPTLIANDHPLSQVNGSFNAVYLHGHACKEMMLQGGLRRFADGERGGGRHSPCRNGGCACASDVCEQRKCGCVAGVHERLENAVFPALVDSGRAGFAGEDCDVAVERAGVDCNDDAEGGAGGKPRAADYHYARGE